MHCNAYAAAPLRGAEMVSALPGESSLRSSAPGYPLQRPFGERMRFFRLLRFYYSLSARLALSSVPSAKMSTLKGRSLANPGRRNAVTTPGVSRVQFLGTP